MARIAGVDLPKNKRIEIALRSIVGIGATTAKKIIDEAGISSDIKSDNLSEEQIAKIRKIIDSKYDVEGDVRRRVASNIKRLKDLGSYKGLRHRSGLPVNGQRTQTNARTRKGKGVAIAGKKKVTK